jgi:hypothetical protein
MKAKEGGWAAAIAGLAALNPVQQQTLVDAALDLPGDKNKAQAIAGLISGYHASKVRGYLR